MSAEQNTLAVLPMYDWPEVIQYTDALWEALRLQLCKRGFAAPSRLTRPLGGKKVYRSPNLLLGQTCGYPLVTELQEAVCLVTTPVYRLDAVPRGFYRSVIIVNSHHLVGQPAAQLRGLRLAYNDLASQSGYVGLAQSLAPLLNLRAFFSAGLCTGSHRESIRAVARSKADVAAIDAVSWGLAEHHEPAAQEVHIWGYTQATPGLPLVTARRLNCKVPLIAEAVEQAIEELPLACKQALLLCGAQRIPLQAYCAAIQPKREAVLVV